MEVRTWSAIAAGKFARAYGNLDGAHGSATERLTCRRNSQHQHPTLIDLLHNRNSLPDQRFRAPSPPLNCTWKTTRPTSHTNETQWRREIRRECGRRRRSPLAIPRRPSRSTRTSSQSHHLSLMLQCGNMRLLLSAWVSCIETKSQPLLRACLLRRNRSTDSRSRNTQELVELVTKSRTVLSSFAKAKTAKLGMYLFLVHQTCTGRPPLMLVPAQ